MSLFMPKDMGLSGLVTPAILDIEAEGSKFQGLIRLQSEFDANVGNLMTLSQNNQQKEIWRYKSVLEPSLGMCVALAQSTVAVACSPSS